MIERWRRACWSRWESRSSPTGRSRKSRPASASSRWSRARSREPRLLVMDEPTASLDFGNQVRVLERIAALAAGGISILFSTHDPDHAFLAAQRALLLAEGRVLALGTPREVIRADTLQRLYHVAVQVVPLEGGGHTCLPALRR